MEIDRTDSARPCCTLMSRASKDVTADASDTALVAAASDTCLRLTNAEMREGSAGPLCGPSGAGLATEALVADKSASCSPNSQRLP